MKVIAICNQKGGVGKTSTAISLATYLAMKGNKTLLVDLDPQGNSTSGLGLDKNTIEKSAYDILLHLANVQEAIITTGIENLSILASNINLTGAEIELVNVMGREYRLQKSLKDLNDEADFVVIDCPPSLGILTINALTAAQSVLIPIQCEYYALEGLGQLIKTVDLVRDNLNQGLYVEGILMTMADNRTRLTDQVISEVQKHFSDKVYKAVIPRSVKMSEAPGFGKPIFTYDRDSSAAKRYEEFGEEFLERCCKSLKTNELGGDDDGKERLGSGVVSADS